MQLELLSLSCTCSLDNVQHTLCPLCLISTFEVLCVLPFMTCACNTLLIFDIDIKFNSSLMSTSLGTSMIQDISTDSVKYL